ncbi:MAG: hypothetical protein FJ086_14710 [Deltaproteobacteria bacterium]|nr:hypothetical protein [Deltaproteobacteria bacterium]
MTGTVVRGVCGLLAAVMILGLVARPPSNAGQVMGALLPVAGLLAVALRGTRRSILPPRKRD